MDGVDQLALPCEKCWVSNFPIGGLRVGDALDVRDVTGLVGHRKRGVIRPQAIPLSNATAKYIQAAVEHGRRQLWRQAWEPICSRVWCLTQECFCVRRCH